MQKIANQAPRAPAASSTPSSLPRRGQSCAMSKVAVQFSNGSNGNGVGQAVPKSLLTSEVLDQTVYSTNEVFSCQEESLFYSQALQKVLGEGYLSDQAATVLEFGAGDGSPVIDALLKVGRRFNGHVHGFELNPHAAGLARARCNQLGLTDKYHVHDSCFFKGAYALLNDETPATWLVANPPYLPAPDRAILMPELHGGVDGATLTNDLLSLGFPNAMLLVSSYSNPVSTIQHAKAQGYSVTTFLVTPLPFGYYSSEPKVKSWIRQMKTEGKAYFSERQGRMSGDGWYLLAGVLFQKHPPAFPATGSDGVAVQVAVSDCSDELIRVLTGL